MLLTIVNIAIVVLGIGLLIFVHELGHFLVAKKVGIRVEAFSLGFGPRVFGFTRGDTEYKICAVPLGGYVKMAGEYGGEDSTGAPDEFKSKTIGQRAWVVSAGVIMNVIFAVLAFPIAFSMGVPFDAPIIGDAVTGLPAWSSGLRPGDRVVAIDDKEVLGFNDIQMLVALGDHEQGARFRVARNGVEIERTVKPQFDEVVGINRVGILPATAPLHFAETVTGRPAPVTPDDEILAIDGAPHVRLAALGSGRFAEFFDPEADELVLTVRRHESGVTEDVAIPADVGPLETSEERWLIGIQLASNRVAAIAPRGEAESGMTHPEAIGFQADDIIIRVADVPVFSRIDVRRRMMAACGGSPFPVVVRRVGRDVSLTIPSLDRRGIDELLHGMALSTHGLQVRVSPASPAESAGLLSGDVIVGIGDTELDPTDASGGFKRLVEAIQASDGDPVTLRVRRGDATVSVSVTPKWGRDLINRTLTKLAPTRRVREDVVRPFPASVKEGFKQTGVQLWNIVQTIRSIFTGSVSAKNVGGIIMIAQASYTFAEQGIAKILFFLAILSLNLAILNILPIPVLDGGHLVFLALEAIKGGPISERAMGLANWAGLILILALMIFVTYNDIMRLL